VEKLSELVENGSLKAEYIHVESEHSAMSVAIGASAVGARTFTATSSQGLLYMVEALYYASGARYPIVMMNANRALAAPWNIYGDQNDSLSQLNSGWIQVYVEDAQEALDMIIQAYMIAEHKEVLTPVMVNLDGFALTHTSEVVNIPDQETVDSILPDYITINKMSLEKPVNACMTAGNQWHMEFRVKQHQAMKASIDIIEATDKMYGEKTGRYYYGLAEAYLCQDAEVVLVVLGSIAGTVRIIVDELRLEGKKVGMFKIRYMRPFPFKKTIESLSSVNAIGVVDKNISYGFEGTVYTNLNSVLKQKNLMIPTIDFIGGIGGRDISKDDIRYMFEKLFNVASGKQESTEQYVNMRCGNEQIL
jgi:pyruvate ferredoxin oxidoreductase alpha subunit